MLDFEVLNEDHGDISILFGEITFMIKSLGLYVGCKETSTTLQFYEDEIKFNKQEKPWGALQYETNHTKVNFRFYRKNIPSILKETLESITEYRQDTNDNKIDPGALSIAFKFPLLERGVHSFLLKIMKILHKELQNLN